MRMFVCADPHFGHVNILKYAGRPFATIEEHDAELVRRWNSVVGKDDSVWLLGDVVMNKRRIEPLMQLNGSIHLVMGNHDNHGEDWPGMSIFASRHGAVKYGGYLLTHYPVHPVQVAFVKGNIHGHMHDKKIDDPRYINVSMEHIEYTPQPLDQVISKHQKMMKEYVG